MNLPSQAQAILLLTVSFGKNDPETAKPLSKSEWARFASWLKDHELKPSSLLKGEVHSKLTGLIDRTVSADRIQSLLERGTTLGLALEKWQRAGLWVMTISDPEYPELLKRHLMIESPAVLFGCGNKNLLNKGGIAIIGSRDASDEDIAFATNLGKETASQGHSIISGGARGVDQSAMSGALDNEGTAIGIMADSMLKAVTSAKYRKKIMSGDLVLITPFNPEAGFNVGNAMARNRYIYCLADAAVVISSTTDKGGTWNGAIEDLKAGWVPLWVKKTSNPNSGNAVLVKKGANWLPDDGFSVDQLTEMSRSTDPDISDLLQIRPKEPKPPAHTTLELAQISEIDAPKDEHISSDIPVLEEVHQPNTLSLFELFILKIRKATAKRALKVGEISEQLGLEKSQTNAWLKRGLAEGTINKLLKPVRYQASDKAEKQASLF